MNHFGHLTICEETFDASNGEVILKNPLGMIVVPSLPTYFTFTISIGLINLKPFDTYNIQIEVNSPSRKSIYKHDLNISMDDPKQNKKTITAGSININCRNLLFEEEGDHVVKLTLGSSVKETLFNVSKKLEEDS